MPKQRKINKHKQHVVMRRLNWDVEFYSDIASGKSFVISEPAEISIDGSKKKSLYGPQSPIYGTSYEDDQAFVERYRCECGEFKSRLFEGEVCPICGQKVEYRDSDINIFGWITLREHRIVSPYYYHLFMSAIGEKVFPDIITAKYKVTTDGKRIRPNKNDEDAPPTSIYAGKGMTYFFDHYEEILTYFKSVKKNKVKLLNTLIKDKRKAFVSHIPVPSTLLRPQSITSDSFYYQSVDKLINTTFSLSERLKVCLPVEKDYLLQRIQTKVNAMWDVYFSELNGKDQLIRGELLGGSLNFTSRDVIYPDPTLRTDEVDLGYFAFRELYKYRIIYYLMRLEDITLAKAFRIWKKSATFSEKVYQVMMFIIKKNDTRVVINRNPTLRVIWCR